VFAPDFRAFRLPFGAPPLDFCRSRGFSGSFSKPLIVQNIPAAVVLGK
jgi:hypothetical protein